MENSPLLPLPTAEKNSADDKDSESSSKNKKKIGKVAVEVQPKEPPPHLLEKAKKAETAEVESTAKAKKAEEAAATLPELPENAPLERLDKTEQQLVERETVEHLRVESEQRPQPSEATAEELAAEEAVENFRDKIVLEGKDSEQAAAETLDEIPSVAEAIQPEIPEPKATKFEPPETVIDTRALGEGELDLSSADADAIASTTRTPGGSGGSMPPFGAGGFNTFPTAAAPNAAPNPNMVSVADAYYYARRAENNGLLVGGVIGYLIGRRRGRIKTEKKLLPIQKKLEKQAKGLREEIIDKENTIRLAAAKAMRSRNPEGAQTVLPRPVSEHRQSVAELRRTPAPGAELLHSTKRLPPERIGHVLITAQTERSSRRTSEAETPRPKTVEKAGSKNTLSAEQQVETMTRNELLMLSEKIAVDGATLRQIYQTHLVGERGLRRIVTEYLRGGDIKRQLRRELIEREIDFERDPILRDRARSSMSSGSGKGALENLLVKAGAASTAEAAEELAIQKAQEAHEQAVVARQRQRRRTADITLVGTILVLLALVIMLFLSRY